MSIDISIEIREVVIPAGQEHAGSPFNKLRVSLVWTCPICGGPRGEVFSAVSYDGSRRLPVSGWRNPCGHVDLYVDCRSEARASGLNQEIFS